MINIKYISVFCMVLLMISCKNSPAETPPNLVDKTTEMKVPRVEVVLPSNRSFGDDQNITGTVIADKMVYVHAMGKGMVQSIAVDIGDRVKKGQVIARLSNPILNIELKEAEVKMLQAKAKYKSAQTELKVKKEEAAFKKTMYDKLQSVYANSKGLITEIEIEKLKNEARIASVHVELAQSRIEEQKTSENAAQILINSAKEKLLMLTIKAPFSGIISGRFVDPGAIIQDALSNNDASPLVSIESTHPMILILPVPESDMGGIDIGDEARVDIPTLSMQGVKAKISRVARSLDARSKTMEVQIDLDNKDGRLRSGMYAKAWLKRSSADDALSIPKEAILIKKDIPYIMIVNDGVIEEMVLKKGLLGRDYVEILNKEIHEKTQIIVKGKSTVKNGQKVEAIIK
ncbi:MAG: efflux RND transporter periplasmic adaptor subunit [Saprospiraceae bacterium]